MNGKRSAASHAASAFALLGVLRPRFERALRMLDECLVVERLDVFAAQFHLEAAAVAGLGQPVDNLRERYGSVAQPAAVLLSWTSEILVHRER